MKKILFAIIAMLGFSYAAPALADSRCGPNAVAAGYYDSRCISTGNNGYIANQSNSNYVGGGGFGGYSGGVIVSGASESDTTCTFLLFGCHTRKGARTTCTNGALCYWDGNKYVVAEGSDKPAPSTNMAVATDGRAYMAVPVYPAQASTGTNQTASTGKRMVLSTTPSAGCIDEGLVDSKTGKKLFNCPL